MDQLLRMLKMTFAMMGCKDSLEGEFLALLA